MIDYFRYAADFLHMISVLILLQKIRQSRNVAGISYRTQEIYLVVFLMRYLDLSFTFINYYNSFMKVFYIGATSYTIYLIRFRKPICLSYGTEQDTFKHYYFLYPGAAILTLLMNRGWSFSDICWSYSIWLEALAILPQLYLIQKHGEVENITSHYMGTLGFYRLFYILSWFHRTILKIPIHYVSILGGILQTAVYADFLWVYIKNYNKSDKIIAV